MVVGDVQSGKTANYVGLVAKALDSGYKMIIVFTGIHNSLRSQTQLRLEESILHGAQRAGPEVKKTRFPYTNARVSSNRFRWNKKSKK